MFREVASPFTKEMLAPLEPDEDCVQFKSLPSLEDLARLSQLLESYPGVELRAYGGYDGSIDDLEFLRHFPYLKRFSADALRYQEFNSIDGLRFLPDDLIELTLGQVKRRISLQQLARFQQLRTLYLEGMNWRDIEVISSLKGLEDLTLRSITLPDLSLLLPLRQLRSLDLKLGGTKDLSLLPELAPLAYLELWMIRGVADLRPVAELESLQFLFLQDLAQVTELPDLSRMRSLRRISLLNLKRLTDLTPLLTAPALEELEVYAMPQLKPEHFEGLLQHPTLTALGVGLGSTRKNKAVEQMLGLPRPDSQFRFRPPSERRLGSPR